MQPTSENVLFPGHITTCEPLVLTTLHFDYHPFAGDLAIFKVSGRQYWWFAGSYMTWK